MGARLGGIVIGAVVIFALRTAFSPSLNQQIITECDKINKVCPKMVDEGVRLDKATAGDMSITLDYTLIGVQPGANELNALQTLITANFKSDKDVRAMLDRNIKVTFQFHDDKGAVLKSFDVTK